MNPVFSLQDLKVAVRSLARDRAFTSVAILTLALGAGATTAIFSVVYGVLLRPLPYPQAEQLVTLGQTARSDPQEPVDGSSSHVNFLDWQRESKTINPMAMYGGSRAVITTGGEADVVRIGQVTPTFFDVFKAVPIVGRSFTPDENRPGGPRVVVVSYGFWQERLGGRAEVLSQTVEISGAPWAIVGVAPRGFDFPNGARLWTPVRNDDQQCGRGCVYLNGIGRLANGATPEQAQQEMSAIAAVLEKEFPGGNFDTTVMVQTLHDRTVGNVRLALIVLLGAVAMVLLIACANVANLVLVRGAARQMEMAVRTALGAGRRGLLSYLLAENLLLGFAGGLAGVVLSYWAIYLVKALGPTNLPRLDDVQLDAPVFLFAAGLIGVTTLIFGLAPSLQLSQVPLAQAMGQRGAIGHHGQRWSRSALLVTEVALSLVLLLGAGLLFRTMAALQRTQLGFNGDGLTVLTLSLPPARYPQAQVIPTFERLDEELGALPGVTAVARISGLPLGTSENVQSFTRLDQPPPPPGQGPGALYRVVDVDYFKTVGIPILAGRGFTSDDRAESTPAIVISQRMAETFWQGENPVGRPVSVARFDRAVIVGVVANVRSQAIASEASPEMYVAHAQAGNRTVTFVVKAAVESAQVINSARQVVKQIDPRLPLIEPSSMAETIDTHLARPRFYLVLIALFAVLAVVLAAVGIYGVVAHVVTQRTREIGVRIALGARRTEVVGLMLAQGLRPAVVGIVLGLAVALGAGRVISGLLYEVRPHDPMTLVSVTIGLILVVMLACAIPAARASRIPPADALRGE